MVISRAIQNIQKRTIISNFNRSTLAHVNYTDFSQRIQPRWSGCRMLSSFTHIDSKSNQPMMVDISDKTITTRVAEAEGRVILPKDVAQALGIDVQKLHTPVQAHDIYTKKGPIIATSIIAGTMAVKNTSNMIPFCHPLPVESIKFTHSFVKHGDSNNSGAVELIIVCRVKVTHKTGVEMEALSGVTVACLTVYDMCKALSHDIVISGVRLVSKTGGKSDYQA